MTPAAVDGVLAAAVAVLAGFGWATHSTGRHDDRVNAQLATDRDEEMADAA